MLRFFHYEKEIDQIKLLPWNISPTSNSITTSEFNIDYPYSSIVLMNDGSLLISNNIQNLIQLILNDQSNDIDDCYIRLSSLHNKNALLPFVKEIAMYFDNSKISHLSTRQYSTTDTIFQEICASLNAITQLEHISLVLQEKKGACLSDADAQTYFHLVDGYISNMTNHYKLISIEENGYEVKNRFFSLATSNGRTLGSINLSLISTLNHLIVSFRSMPNVNLTLDIKDSTIDKLQVQTLELPCVPSTSKSIDILDLNQLKILDIGYVYVNDRIELTRLDQILFSHRQKSLRDLTISLSE
ncbi:unnamed protein product [Rotaria sp. Silwood1]|nr:unnamed protein product [Rotaria sp. Silwood1]CAF1681772.1 unnamed protein product [Rotaria sp. Silwood1]